MATSTMKRAALMALMAQIFASQSKAGAEISNQGAPLFGMPILRDSGSPESFGIWRANSRTHKRYLRQHHLGKFKKGRR